MSATTGRPREASSGRLRLGGETADDEIGRVDLEDEGSLRSDGRGVVTEPGAVGRPHLPDPRTGRGEQFVDAKAVPDLHELAPAEQDFPSRGQGGRRQRQRGSAVVDDMNRLGARYGVPQGAERGAAAAGTAPAVQIELHVRASGGGRHRLHRCPRERGATEVGVHDHPRRVVDRAQPRRLAGQRGQDRADDVLRLHVPLPHRLLYGLDGFFDHRSAQPRDGRPQERVVQ